jgi:type I restriction enzyme M protein
MPHGVLFRGGAERDIRTRLLDDDIIEAVIGLAPNLFYGTGIPACILVLRPPGSSALRLAMVTRVPAQIKCGGAEDC